MIFLKAIASVTTGYKIVRMLLHIVHLNFEISYASKAIYIGWSLQCSVPVYLKNWKRWRVQDLGDETGEAAWLEGWPWVGVWVAWNCCTYTIEFCKSCVGHSNFYKLSVFLQNQRFQKIIEIRAIDRDGRFSDNPDHNSQKSEKCDGHFWRGEATSPQTSTAPRHVHNASLHV